MAKELVGKVLFANGAPAAGVRIRVFDKDAPGQRDDDLTVHEGVSDEDGRFTVQYEPSRYLDYAEGMAEPESALSVDLASNRGMSLFPDLTDIYQPYLEFRYTHRGQARRHTAWLIPLVTRFRLPDVRVPDQPFQPSVHGFRFWNSFPGYPLPISVPELPNLPFVPKEYGLCGGMASAACDFYLAERDIPADTQPPGKKKSLHGYLYRRQLDTFGALGEYVAKFYAWMALPDGTIYGTHKGTYDQFERARAQLDDGMPVILGLVYVSLRETLEMWQNHQVLAYAWEQVPPDGVRIHIYDPNYPRCDRVSIEAERVIAGSRLAPGLPPRKVTAYGLRCMQKTPGQADKPVRGFFVMPYVPVTPPPRL